jgi:uncharacterized lipoprotein YddW (UPF0748 family)
MEDLEDNPDKDLCRYEFYEIFVRIADEKYRKPKISASLSEAVEKLLIDNIFKYSDFVHSWQKWRTEKLWNILVDDLYKANLDSLKKLFTVRFTELLK